MIVFKNTLVIIPARGGSKRIPNKNIKMIFGNPMIYWPLMELKKLFKSEDILISTDSKTIKSIVEKKGIKVPFIRPKTLSDDFTGTDDVISHALNWYENFYSLKVDYVLTVYPTAVLLSSQDLLVAFKTLKLNPKCDSIMSATTRFSHTTSNF